MPKPAKAPKARLDQLLVDRGLAKDLREAGALLLRGAVHSGDTKLSGPASLVRLDLPLRVRGRRGAVSRAGAKLKAALEAWGLDLRAARCLDVGASTGGFTQVMLEAGAASVVSVDVGTDQLAFALRQDPRVRCLEQTDIRSLSPAQAGAPFDFASIDVSFVGLARVLPAVAGLLKPGARWVALVKPQFEASKAEVGKGGIVRDAALRERLLRKVQSAAQSLGLAPSLQMPSPVLGKKGNQEFLIAGQKN